MNEEPKKAGIIKKYKYIRFEFNNVWFEAKPLYECVNIKSGSVLAKIFWYKPWKQYCFTQAEQNVVFNDGCLSNIIDFIKELKEKK